MDHKLIIVQTTVPDVALANKMAAMLVESRLAACVQIFPGNTSFYMWNGRLNSDKEYCLQIKTIEDKFEELKAAILNIHPYEVPEIMAVEAILCHDDFLEWAISETREIGNQD